MTVTPGYAPIHSFHITQDAIPSGVLRGFAAPSGGKAACALALMSGSETMSIAVASGFSEDARQQGLRRGWCEFRLSGFHQVLAGGQDAEVRCLVSGEVQARWDAMTLAMELAVQQRRHLTFTDMWKQLRETAMVSDIRQVVPFAIALAETGGTRPFLEASFRYLLNRPPDVAAFKEFTGNYTESEAVRECWSMIMNGMDFGADRKYRLPGPFDPSFPFPTDILELREIETSR